MAYMNSTTRQSIVDVCRRQGFGVQLKQDGFDIYEKNLVFKAEKYRSRVFINCVTGINKSSGNLSYLKVAVDPAHFKMELVNLTCPL